MYQNVRMRAYVDLFIRIRAQTFRIKLDLRVCVRVDDVYARDEMRA